MTISEITSKILKIAGIVKFVMLSQTFKTIGLILPNKKILVEPILTLLQNNLEKNKNLKEEIIQTAIKKFSKNGFSNTSMDEIAKESKVSKGLLFYHFKNKEELYLQALS